MGRRPNVFTIPADADFSATLVHAIRSGELPHAGARAPDPLALADWTVLVPTRRAVRTIVTAFAGQDPQPASLLPQIRPLGDADEDDIQGRSAVSGGPELDVAPEISRLQRQFVLSRLIAEWLDARRDSELAANVLNSVSQAMSLAESLGDLIDRFETDEVQIDAVRQLFDSELAMHREDFLEFLDIVRLRYPAYLAEHGFSGQMARRSQLIRAQAALLAAAPPGAPVIAAGSTGSIPATAELLKTIAWLPAGAVVVPGLDLDCDEQSWDVLEPHHPQYGLRELLAHIGITRAEVRRLGTAPNADRRWFLSEVMRPGATSENWHAAVGQGAGRFESACDGLTWLQAPDRRSEALTVALIMRRTLEQGDRTAALITPDRQLARQVKTELGRWAIAIDDSAGEPVSRSPQGAFLSLLADAALDGFRPARLVALLDHPYALFGMARADLARQADHLEVAVFRGHAAGQGLEALTRQVELRRGALDAYSHASVKRLGDDDWQAISALANRLTGTLADVEAMFSGSSRRPLQDYIKAHIRTAEAISHDAELDRTPLWQGEAGSVLSDLLRSLNANAEDCPDLTPSDYIALIQKQMASASVRPRHSRHPRLAIYGLLEARLQRADVTIVAGLNEGTWPDEADIDPWLNRPQKAALALQLPERRLGLMAHDFAQAVAGNEVWMTSSRKIDGQPAVASRWLLRMKALLKAAGSEGLIQPAEPWIGWSLGIDTPGPQDTVRIKPPQPSPPVAARPSRLSVTRIDRLIRDPYGIFAQYILSLEPLEDIERKLGGREKGNLVHAALERFVRNNPGPLGRNAGELLMAEFRRLFDERVSDPALHAFWLPQMQRIADWFVARERQWRSGVHAQHVEQKAAYSFDVAGATFTLSCIADRMDVLDDGSVRLIDYKTGQLPGAKPSSDSYSVQLDLEAHMAIAGAFEAVGPVGVRELVYARLAGGNPPGELRTFDGDVAGRAVAEFDGLVSLLSDYADPRRPYAAIGAASREDRAFDYDHLSRWREWYHLDDAEPAP